MSTQFKQRIWMSFLTIFSLAILISYSDNAIFKPIFFLTASFIFTLALVEFYHLAQKKGFAPQIYFGCAAGISYVVTTYVSLEYPQLSLMPFLSLLFFLLLLFIPFFADPKGAISNLSITVFGLVYIILPLTCFLQILYFKPTSLHSALFTSQATITHNKLWLAYVLTITKTTDIGAYFSGKLFGKHALIPKISPKKTVEGLIGGIFLALLAASIFYFYFFESFALLSYLQTLILSLFLSLLAHLGDLAESVLKRDADVKDSSDLPGFGGIFDMVDSLIFTLPFMYFVLRMEWI